MLTQEKKEAAVKLPASAPPGFHLLAKPVGPVCNLDCAYCYFLEKEMLYPGSRFRMSDEVLEQYIKQLIEAHSQNQVNIAWQGGEPTMMGLDFYRMAPLRVTTRIQSISMMPVPPQSLFPAYQPALTTL